MLPCAKEELKRQISIITFAYDYTKKFWKAMQELNTDGHMDMRTAQIEGTRWE